MDYLKKLRIEKGLTRNFICEQTGISLSKFSKLERSEIDALHCSFVSMAYLFTVLAPEGIDILEFVNILHHDHVLHLVAIKNITTHD